MISYQFTTIKQKITVSTIITHYQPFLHHCAAVFRLAMAATSRVHLLSPPPRQIVPGVSPRIPPETAWWPCDVFRAVARKRAKLVSS